MLQEEHAWSKKPSGLFRTEDDSLGVYRSGAGDVRGDAAVSVLWGHTTGVFRVAPPPGENAHINRPLTMNVEPRRNHLSTELREDP